MPDDRPSIYPDSPIGSDYAINDDLDGTGSSTPSPDPSGGLGHYASAVRPAARPAANDAEDAQVSHEIRAQVSSGDANLQRVAGHRPEPRHTQIAEQVLADNGTSLEALDKLWPVIIRDWNPTAILPYFKNWSEELANKLFPQVPPETCKMVLEQFDIVEAAIADSVNNTMDARHQISRLTLHTSGEAVEQAQADTRKTAEAASSAGAARLRAQLTSLEAAFRRLTADAAAVAADRDDLRAKLSHELRRTREQEDAIYEAERKLGDERELRASDLSGLQDQMQRDKEDWGKQAALFRKEIRNLSKLCRANGINPGDDGLQALETTTTRDRVSQAARVGRQEGTLFAEGAGGDDERERVDGNRSRARPELASDIIQERDALKEDKRLLEQEVGELSRNARTANQRIATLEAEKERWAGTVPGPDDNVAGETAQRGRERVGQFNSTASSGSSNRRRRRSRALSRIQEGFGAQMHGTWDEEHNERIRGLEESKRQLEAMIGDKALEEGDELGKLKEELAAAEAKLNERNREVEAIKHDIARAEAAPEQGQRDRSAELETALNAAKRQEEEVAGQKAKITELKVARFATLGDKEKAELAEMDKERKRLREQVVDMHKHGEETVKEIRELNAQIDHFEAMVRGLRDRPPQVIDDGAGGTRVVNIEDPAWLAFLDRHLNYILSDLLTLLRYIFNLVVAQVTVNIPVFFAWVCFYTLAQAGYMLYVPWHVFNTLATRTRNLFRPASNPVPPPPGLRGLTLTSQPASPTDPTPRPSGSGSQPPPSSPIQLSSPTEPTFPATPTPTPFLPDRPVILQRERLPVRAALGAVVSIFVLYAVAWQFAVHSEKRLWLDTNGHRARRAYIVDLLHAQEWRGEDPYFWGPDFRFLEYDIRQALQALEDLVKWALFPVRNGENPPSAVQLGVLGFGLGTAMQWVRRVTVLWWGVGFGVITVVCLVTGLYTERFQWFEEAWAHLQHRAGETWLSMLDGRGGVI